MSITALVTTAATSVSDVSTRLSVRAAIAASDAVGPVVASGLITTLNDQISQIKVLIVSISAVLAVIAFFVLAIKKNWSTGGIIQGLFVGALIGFGGGLGGTAWLANQFKDQVGS